MLKIFDVFSPISVFQVLIYVTILVFSIWCVQYHWSRRRLYKMASKFPGPISLPFIGNGLYFVGSTSDILYNAVSLMRKFKTPQRAWLGHRLIFTVTSPEHLEIIMNSPHALEKEGLYKYLEPFIGTGLLTASVPKWKRHRKVVMPTFNQRILDDFVPVFVQQTSILSEQLKKEIGKGNFNVFNYVSRCALDIICETVMGVRVEAQTKDSDYLEWANRAMEIIFTKIFNVWYHFDFIFNLTSLSTELNDVRRKMHHFTGIVVKRKRETYQKERREKRKLTEGYVSNEPPRRKTFLQQLIELSEEGANFTDDELREEVDTFMVAGSDTTASVISFVFIMLGMFPDVQEKVYQEVMDVLGSDRSIEASDLRRFPYMERVMRETMRIFPVGPILARAITKDIQLDKWVIPAESSVMMGIIGLHWDETVWPEPFKFDPDRFLPEEVAKRHPYSWLPFSGGPRNCIGRNYAFMVMKTLIATVVRKHKFSTNYCSIRDIKLKVDVILRPANGYNVSVEPRQ